MNRGNGHINAWTPEREEIVRVMWLSGSSASEIAKALACGFSRNAIIGKVHRRGWTCRGEVSATAKPAGRNHARDQRRAAMRAGRPIRPAHQTVVAKTKPRPPTRICEPVEPLPDNAVPLEKLTGYTCRWPIGDPASDTFGFCGCMSPLDQPYCDWHMRKAYTRTSRTAKAYATSETDKKLRDARRWAA